MRCAAAAALAMTTTMTMLLVESANKVGWAAAMTMTRTAGRAATTRAMCS